MWVEAPQTPMTHAMRAQRMTGAKYGLHVVRAEEPFLVEATGHYEERGRQLATSQLPQEYLRIGAIAVVYGDADIPAGADLIQQLLEGGDRQPYLLLARFQRTRR